MNEQSTEERVIVRDGAAIGIRYIENKQTRRAIGMIHGLASNKTRWDEFIDHTSLHQDWNLVSLDLRGHNQSLWRGRLTRRLWARDVYDVMRAKQFEQVVLIGHSLGAQVAMEYAMRHRDLIDGLVLIDPVFENNLTGLLALARRTKYILWGLLGLVWLANLLGLRKRRFPTRSLRELDIQTRRFLAENPHKDIAELYMSPFEDMKYLPLANYIQDILEVVRPVGAIETVTCPVLVLLSSGASMSNVDKNIRTIKQMPQSEIHYVEADHWLLTEKPDEARRAIEAWCRTQQAAAYGD